VLASYYCRERSSISGAVYIRACAKLIPGSIVGVIRYTTLHKHNIAEARLSYLPGIIRLPYACRRSYSAN